VIGPVGEVTMRALVADFAHPAGNVTGAHITGKEADEKCLQLLKEAVPTVSRMGVLINPQNPAWNGYPEVLAGAVRPLGVELVGGQASGAADIDRALQDMAAKSINGLFVAADANLTDGPAKPRILEWLSANRLPSVSDDVYFTAAGGLLSLAADLSTVFRGAAEYIHRILQGAKPSELPVVSPKLLMSVNLGTATKLGIAIPEEVIARADEVIR
jgi:putative ABC transport system substrate-binding protein